MRAEDIEHLVSVGRPSVAADGSRVVFASSRPDLAANRYVGQVWQVELPDGKPRRLTRGVADRSPAFSPDGSRIAFLRGDSDDRAQIFVIPAEGGEAVQTSDQPGGVTEFSWSPDGSQIAFIARDPEHGRYGTVAGLPPSAESPRHITTVRWHANGVGYVGDRPTHVFVVDAPDPFAEPRYARAAHPHAGDEDPAEAPSTQHAATQLTDGDANYALARFSADGEHIVAVRADPERVRPTLARTLVAIAVDGAGQQQLLGAPDVNLDISDLVVASDGSLALLAADVGPTGIDFVAPGVALWLLVDGELTRLTDPDRHDLGEACTHLTAIGDDFLAQHRTRGRVELLRVRRDASSEVIRGGDVEVTAHAASSGETERIVAVLAVPDRLSEVELVGGKRLTTFGSRAARGATASISEHEITGRDGYPVHGWVATPAGEGPFPVILQIHGGPYAQYGIHLFDETQVLVDAGYAVVYANPRGSAGYGREHGRSIKGVMGTVDFTDVMDFLDGVLGADARLDRDRLGIMGGSYGGYLTAWTIAHDHRFAAAIVERGYLDPAAFRGTSDIGTFFGNEYNGTSREQIDAQSPMAVVDQVATPTLVIHSEEDYRCPLEQATRYYSELRRGGVAAELLIFPGENHELTRAGSPRHRVERFDAVLDWWARHLPV